MVGPVEYCSWRRGQMMFEDWKRERKRNCQQRNPQTININIRAHTYASTIFNWSGSSFFFFGGARSLSFLRKLGENQMLNQKWLNLNRMILFEDYIGILCQKNKHCLHSWVIGADHLLHLGKPLSDDFSSLFCLPLKNKNKMCNVLLEVHKQIQDSLALNLKYRQTTSPVLGQFQMTV